MWVISFVPDSLSMLPRDQREKKLARDAVEKQCYIYAIDMLKRFVAQRLDGDIRKLKDFNFGSLKDDREFGDEI